MVEGGQGYVEALGGFGLAPAALFQIFEDYGPLEAVMGTVLHEAGRLAGSGGGVPEMGFGFVLSFFLFWGARFRCGGTLRSGTLGCAGCLQRAKLFERFEVVSGETGLVAGELGERVGAGGVVDEDFAAKPDIERVKVVRPVLGVILDPTMSFVEAPGKQAGLEVGDAAQAPLGVGKLADQAALELGCGPEFLEQFGEQGLELAGVFAGQDGAVGDQSMGEGVAPGDGFAFGGAGTGAVLGVAAVGFGPLIG